MVRQRDGVDVVAREEPKASDWHDGLGLYEVFDFAAFELWAAVFLQFGSADSLAILPALTSQSPKETSAEYHVDATTEYPVTCH